ncbi:MAG: ATP-dependent DNA helicase RecG [Candidatus Nanopelagicales bacterium]|nr:ATP-dependent DNA helicase RecG [Candidatus Nanopelagicales bacterium]
MTGSGVQLSTPLRDCVGGRTAKALETGFGMTTVRDLLLHAPRRYVERGQLSDLSSLHEGDEVTVVAEVRSARVKPMRGGRNQMLEVIVTDGTAELSLTFFRQAWRAKDLSPGRRGLFAGKVNRFNRRLQLTHPDYLILSEDDAAAAGIAAARDFAGSLIPVYPATGSMKTWKISNAVTIALDQVVWELEPDPLGQKLRERHGLVDAACAFEGIHRPKDMADVRAGQRRLRWEEALALQTVLAVRRSQWRAQPAVARSGGEGALVAALDDRLPFELTAGQREVSKEIMGELASVHPMHRLLQGEVGSGKTIVALRAMLAVVESGGQAALLAPTEVLASQHYRSITTVLGPIAARGMLGGDQAGTEVVLVTGSQPTAARRGALLKAASGEAGIVIGTHALLEDRVVFADLGLVVVDEQHRFGVEQRAALTGKSIDGLRPHVLVMTATPIPRTVAMTVFGDLETSTLRELPAGRTPIATHVVPVREKPGYLTRTWERIREEVARGRQAYVVCPRIGSAEDSDEGLEPMVDVGGDGDSPPAAVVTASVEETLEQLSRGPLAGLRLSALHGRMSGEDKDLTMRRFSGDPTAADGLDVLVSTTVIEVGVDVANATVMVIMDADRFGVSQLHQLRGRVGRGSEPGLCLLVTSTEADSAARQRLEAVSATTDGFELSVLDLQNRREGDVLGAEQSGRKSSLRSLSLLRDELIIADARLEAVSIVEADPQLTKTPALRDLAAQIVGPDAVDWLDRS